MTIQDEDTLTIPNSGLLYKVGNGAADPGYLLDTLLLEQPEAERSGDLQFNLSNFSRKFERLVKSIYIGDQKVAVAAAAPAVAPAPGVGEQAAAAAAGTTTPMGATRGGAATAAAGTGVTMTANAAAAVSTGEGNDQTSRKRQRQI